jgi:hypothetical protein
MAVSRFMDTELGRECRCSKCKKYWPADSEFFHVSKGVLHCWCKACYAADPRVLAKLAKQRNAAVAAVQAPGQDSFAEVFSILASALAPRMESAS